jgi:ribosomal-protein-alanine N-acetyltransferase
MSIRPVDSTRTARLLLTRPCPDDGDDLARMHADPRVTATLGGVRSAEQSREVFGRVLHHWEEHGFGFWVARDPDSGRFLGSGGPRRVVVEGRDEVEVGYGLVFDAWGRGLATELAREAVRIGFEALCLPELICFTLPTNRASRRVMEKAGFRYEREAVHADRPHVLYRLAAADWRAEVGR